MSIVKPKECIMLYTVPRFSPRPLFLGDTNMAVFHANPSRLCGQAISYIGLDRLNFHMVYARLNAITAVPHGCFYTPVHMVGCTSDSGAPQSRRGHMPLCENRSELMAESVYDGYV